MLSQTLLLLCINCAILRAQTSRAYISAVMKTWWERCRLEAIWGPQTNFIWNNILETICKDLILRRGLGKGGKKEENSVTVVMDLLVGSKRSVWEKMILENICLWCSLRVNTNVMTYNSIKSREREYTLLEAANTMHYWLWLYLQLAASQLCKSWDYITTLIHSKQKYCININTNPGAHIHMLMHSALSIE